MREERRALEDAGALLVDHDVVRLDRELVVDREAVGRNRRLRGSWSMSAPRGRLFGRVSWVQKKIGMPARRAAAKSCLVGAIARWAKMPQVLG